MPPGLRTPAPNLSRLARELRVRQQNRAISPVWWKTSPSTQLMVALCTVRDTRAPGPDRFQWSVTILGWPRPATERTTDLAKARLLAETALAAYVRRRAADQATPGGQ
jgi:hypothetical protein